MTIISATPEPAEAVLAAIKLTVGEMEVTGKLNDMVCC